MLERDIEQLIADFPGEFFPGYALTLKGRQQAFAGIGRFDLLFTDAYGTNILMELKAVTAKYENATQLAKYKEALEARGERNILMWLVAPSIPHSVREFLERIGIEHTEIHEVQLRRVAERHGIVIAPNREPSAPQQTRSASRVRQPVYNVDTMPSNGYKLLSPIDKLKLVELVEEFEAAVKRSIDKSLAVRLRKEILEPQSPSLSRSTILQLARWCKTPNPLYWDGMEVAKKISQALFGLILDRERLGT